MTARIVVWSVNPQVHVIAHNVGLVGAKRLVTDAGYPTIPHRATELRDTPATGDVTWMEIVSAFSHEEAVGWVIKESENK